MGRQLREVYFVDGVRTAFGRAGEKGIFWRTRADDMAVKVVRELLRRNPSLPPERDRRRDHGRDRAGRRPGADARPRRRAPRRAPADGAGLRGRPHVRRRADGDHGRRGRDRDGRRRRRGCGRRRAHGPPPDGRRGRLQPALRRRADRRRERRGDGRRRRRTSTTASRRSRARTRTRFALRSQQRAAAAWANGVMASTVVPMSVFTDEGWAMADRDEFLRPETTLEGLAGLPTPFRAGGRVTAGNSAGLTDGATAALLASEEAVAELGLEPQLRLVSFAYAGVEPELMGIGPVPATERALDAGRPDARRDRPLRAERAVRRPGAHVVRRARRRSRTTSG